MSQQRKFFPGWLVVASGFVIMATCYTIFVNCMSLFQPLVVSDLGITLAQYNISNAISTVVSVIGSLVIGHVADKVSGRVLGSLTVIATSAVLAGMSFVGELWFSAAQALLAARAGATYVSPFLGRLDDISTPGMDLIRTIADIFAMYDDIDTQIIAASVRNPIHVIDCALAGADIATVPYNVLMQMVKHPLTDQGIEKFKKDYIAVFGE